MRSIAVVVMALAVAGLAACETGPKAPRTTGVCYFASDTELAKDEPNFAVVARNQPQIEFCAARLEEMRLRFLRMGGTNREIVGAYQGQFIFIQARGVSFARSFGGVKFFALARTGDGRLAIPGAIQRDIDAAPAAPQG